MTYQEFITNRQGTHERIQSLKTKIASAKWFTGFYCYNDEQSRGYYEEALRLTDDLNQAMERKEQRAFDNCYDILMNAEPSNAVLCALVGNQYNPYLAQSAETILTGAEFGRNLDELEEIQEILSGYRGRDYMTVKVAIEVLIEEASPRCPLCCEIIIDDDNHEIEIPGYGMTPPDWDCNPENVFDEPDGWGVRFDKRELPF